VMPAAFDDCQRKEWWVQRAIELAFDFDAERRPHLDRSRGPPIRAVDSGGDSIVAAAGDGAVVSGSRS